MNNDAPTPVLPDNWRETLNEMQQEWVRLHQEVAQLRIERNQLSKALLALMHEDVTLTEEEILARIGYEKPLREFLDELRAQLVRN
jgi:seryl-tRNA synthetase